MPSRDNSKQDTDLGSASSAALQQYCIAAKHLGVDVDTILIRLGLEQLMVNDSGHRISGLLFQKLLVELVNAVEQPCFGLASAHFVRPESYSILGYISMNAMTLRSALERVIPFEKVVGDMGRTELIENNQQLLIRWHCQYQEPSIIGVMVENVLASWGQFARWLVADEDIVASEVHFRHACPSGQLSQYEDFFNCPVLFEQEHNQLIVEQSLLDLPIKMPNLALLEVFAEQAQHQISQLTDNDYCYKVKQAIREGLGRNASGKEDVAQRLFVSGRTLQRKLELQGTCFRLLYDQVRLAEARRLLILPQTSLEHLALALDFSDTSSMQRWFRRVAGVSAGKFAKTMTY